MYDEITYETLLGRMLERAGSIDGNVDTREGSLVWLGSAPVAMELQNLYLALDNLFAETFADTASREYLIRRAGERGIVPYSATPAVLRLEVVPTSLSLSMNTRFSIGALNYAVTDDLGIAPIGHVVKVQGVEAETVDLSFSLYYQRGWAWDDVKGYVTDAVNAYFLELAKSWADQEEALVCRISQVESRLLDIDGILDIAGTKLNGAATNYALALDHIPVLGEITASTITISA